MLDDFLECFTNAQREGNKKGSHQATRNNSIEPYYPGDYELENGH